jgi:hypothetical protein
MTNSTKRTSCHSFFKKLGILPLQAQYILSISMFIIANKELFTFNSQVHNLNIRSRSVLSTNEFSTISKGNMLYGSKDF